MADERDGEEQVTPSSPPAMPAHTAPLGDPLARVPMSYDFKRPQRVNKDQIRAIESLHEQFARLFSSTISTAMRTVVDIDLAFVDQPLYGEFIVSLPNPCGAFSFTVEPTGGKAVLCLAPELMMSIVDRALGGKGQAPEGDMRPLTQIEQGIVNKLVSRLLGDVETAWEPHYPLEVTDVTYETNPEFVQVAGPGDPTIITAFEAHSNTANGLVSLCYPLSTLEALLPRLDLQSNQTQREQPRGDAVANNRSLSKMRVPVLVQIAKGSLPLKEIAELQQGDVIKLDTKRTEPAIVFLGDQPKFIARAGLDGRQRAAQILSTIDASEEELYR